MSGSEIQYELEDLKENTVQKDKLEYWLEDSKGFFFGRNQRSFLTVGKTTQGNPKKEEVK